MRQTFDQEATCGRESIECVGVAMETETFDREAACGMKSTECVGVAMGAMLLITASFHAQQE